MTLKAKFIDAIINIDEPKVLVVAVKLPTGAIETIQNTQELESKIKYYCESYDMEFKLIANPVIEIVGFMIV